MRVAFLTFLVLVGYAALLFLVFLSVARIFTTRFSRLWQPCFYLCLLALVALMSVLPLTYHRHREAINDDFANNSIMLLPLAIVCLVLPFVAFKRPHRYIALSAVSLVIVAFFCYAWSLSRSNLGLLEKKLRSLSGEGQLALNCNSAELRQERDAWSDCALNAFAQRHPFYVRYGLQGIDSEVAVGLAGDAQGKVYFVAYDSLGWQSEGLPEGAQVTDDKHIYTEPCASPVTLRKTRTGRLTCAKSNASNSRDIMSPTLEPY